MSFINWLKSIFADGPAKNEIPGQEKIPTAPLPSYVDRWERERQERIRATEERLRDWMLLKLRQTGQLEFTWQSGHDEAFVTFNANDGSEAENFEDLEFYIIDQLDIPDAGEFDMEGSGAMYIEGNTVKVKYASVLKATIDYDEETDTEAFGEEVKESGDKILFTAW